MTSMKYRLFTLLIVCGLGFSSVASAELFSRANGTMVYDSVRDITWIADANYVATQWKQDCPNMPEVDGSMYWHAAKILTEKLDFGGYTDWRLPKLSEDDPTCDDQGVAGDFGLNCKGGELGHLFYEELGGVAGESILKTHNANFNKFKNVQNDIYWYDLEFSALPFISWNFHTRNGNQNGNSKSVKLFVWPVRDGDVADQVVDYTHTPISCI